MITHHLALLLVSVTQVSGLDFDIRTSNQDLVDDHMSLLMMGKSDVISEEPQVSERFIRSFYRTGDALGKETSKTLDYLLFESGYNRRVRPVSDGDGPVLVNVNLDIRSMGPVDEMNEVYSLDCYFRQSWLDRRLSYSTGGLDELALNWAFLAKIWVPDTFFVNGKQSFLHKITVPNRFVRIMPDGTVSYSQRLTLQASCPMNLVKFPLDSQTCKLQIGSFAYTANDVVYRWQKQPFSIAKEVALAQFHLADASYDESIGVSGRRDRQGFRNDSRVELSFLFERQTGFFLLQIYTPLTLIVFCSWVSFWLVKTETGGEVPARTALGATTVLSIVNLGFGGKSKPKVGYATALDMYIILCFAAVFAALVEFACINFIDIFIKRFKIWENEEKKRLESETNVLCLEEENDVPEQNGGEKVNGKAEISQDEERELIIIIENGKSPKIYDNEKPHNPFVSPLATSECVSTISTQDACVSTEDEDFEDILDEVEEVGEKTSPCLTVVEFCDKMFDNFLRRIFRRYSPRIPKMIIYTDTLAVIYSIDDISRKGFPLVFLLLQILYWMIYLYFL